MAPICWALVNMVDVYLVDGIYQDSLEATIISGLFQLIPLVGVIFFGNVDFSDVSSWPIQAVAFSFFGGLLYTSAFYFYFRALFEHNDVTFVQIVWSLTIVAVPLISFVLFGEQLSAVKYVGMAIVLSGSILLALNGKLRTRFVSKYFWIMLGAVILLSLSMIFSEKAYSIMSDAYGKQGFVKGFLIFISGAFSAGLSFAIFSRRNPIPTIKKYYKIFLMGEGIYFLGNFASQIALDIAPSASFIAVVETFTPVFVMMYSLAILFFFSVILKKKNEVIRRIYAEQINGVWVKFLAVIVMATGLYVMS